MSVCGHADSGAQRFGRHVVKGAVFQSICAIRDPLYDETNTDKVGSSNGGCFRAAVRSAYESIWTATVPGGQPVVEVRRGWVAK